VADAIRAWQRDILDAAEERDWTVVRLDLRDGVVLEDPRRLLTIRIVGVTLTADFIRRLPLADADPVRKLADDSLCWCRFDNGVGHESKCRERREVPRET
jgi:hypothetical protein